MTLSPQERWFVDRGLAYFADPVRATVWRRLALPRLVPALLVLFLLSVSAGVLTTKLIPGEQLAWVGFTVGAQLFGVLCLAYALFALRAGSITRWAIGRTFESLWQHYPLVTKALPMLLVFITFLFINTEVWQVATTLNASTMASVVSTFALLAVLFLYARLAKVVGHYDDKLDGQRVCDACAGTPFEAYADLDEQPGIDEPLDRLERANLVLAMLVTQVIQVLLLSLAVMAFFLLFGMLTINADVVKSWTGHPPTPILWGLLNQEILRVSVFLSGFAALYFTVTAVNDETYRQEFFGSLEDETEQALAAREVYRAIQRAD